MPSDAHTLPLAGASIRARREGGCGCGGCGCGGGGGEASVADGTQATSYAVTGMTCGHCVAAVTGEIEAIPGVESVTVDLVADGVSTVTVTSAEALDDAAIAAALDEAGGYLLV